MTDESMRKTIAGNISRYRKQLGMTQLDLSEKINYSDKSISKWERGDGIPDVPTMVQLAEIFGVSVDDLIYPPQEQPQQPVESEEPEKRAKPGDSTDGRFCWRHFFITLLSIAGVWLVAILIVCLFQYIAPGIADLWDGRVMCYAVTASFVVFLIFASLWWPRAWIFIAISGIVWGAALSVFVTFSGISGGGVIFPCRRAGTAGVAVLFLALLCKASVAHPVSVPKEKIKQVRKAQYCNREMDFRCIVMKSFPYCGTVPFFVRESKILKRVEWFCTGVGGFYLKKGVY